MKKEIKPRIVCAAIKYENYIIAGARHFDGIMHKAIDILLGTGWTKPKVSDWQQGFIDQWGKFYNRKEAMQIVKASGQPFDAERNSGNGQDLYSEGLY